MPEPSAHRLLRTVLLGACAVAALAGAPAALADDPPPAVSEYTEQVPSGAGAKPQGTTSGKKAKLPTHAQRRLRQQGGKDAAALREVATSAGLGAPTAAAQPSSPAPATVAPAPAAKPARAAKPEHGAKPVVRPKPATKPQPAARPAAAAPGASVRSSVRAASASAAAQGTLAAPSGGPSVWIFFAASLVLALSLVAAAALRFVGRSRRPAA